MARLAGILLSGTIPAMLLIASFFQPFDDRDPPDDSPSPIEVFDADVPSIGNHSVPVTVHKPAGASAERRVPVILHSHGWAGKRVSDPKGFTPYLAAGFGVVSIDMRGHGEARETSQARVHHMDFEIEDVRAVINYVSGLPWAQLDRPGDPRIGAMGGSYGGGFQLLTAAVDDRLDALVPGITWNDLVQSLVPNGAPKSAWLDLLYAGGNVNVQLHPSIHQAFAYLQAANRIPDGSVPGTPDIRTQFTESSPRSYPGGIDVPTLLVQGMPDTLFNFNEAAANYALIRSNGAPVSLVTYLGGHILSTQGTIPVPAPTPIGLQPGAGLAPCGMYDQLAVAWFQKHLQNGKPSKIHDVCLALDDGTTVTGKSYPLPGTAMRRVTFPSGTIVAQGPPGPNVTLHAWTANASTVVAGIPKLTGTVQSAGPDAIVYWKLVIYNERTQKERVANSQVTPLRLALDPAVAQSFSIDLGGVAFRLLPGETLRLVVGNVDPQFAHNSERLPGAVVFGGLSLDVPIVPERPGNGS